jgi:hypothetical protein
MYKQYPNFLPHETLEYDRMSRTDDPTLTLDEILEKHEKILEEYAIRNLGGPIPAENKFKEVVSSETIDGRPEMLRLLKAIESPAVKAILTVEVQRLSRGDLEDAGRLIKILRYTKTFVITPTKIYDLRDEFDRDAFERELKRGNEYLEYFKKIQARGKLASVSAGNYVGSVAPFGFTRKKIIENKKKTYFILEEKPEEAEIVRMIFDWYANEEIGVTAICRRLEAMNIKTKTGASKWKPSIIFGMLENVHYIGYVRWNWRKTVKIIEDQEVKELRPKAKVDEYLIFEGKHDGIVSKEIFEKAARVRGSKPPVRNDVTVKNPFVNLVYCRVCGSKIGRRTYEKRGKEYSPPRLRCNGQVYCKSGSVPFHEFEEYVVKTLKDCVADFEVLIKSERDDSSKLHKNLIVGLERKLKELEEKEVQQWEDQYDPDKMMPGHIFKKLNKKLLKEKEEVKNALDKAREAMPEPVDYKDKLMKFTDALKALEDTNLNARIKNQYLRDIIEKIEVYRPPAIKITNENRHLYREDIKNRCLFHNEPYEIRIKLRD